MLDQGPHFQSSEFRSLLNAAGINAIDAGAESHNALGEVERYHAYLRNIFDRVQFENQEMQNKVGLALAVKAFNDTAESSGMVPTLLVFGVAPRMPAHPDELPDNVDA